MWGVCKSRDGTEGRRYFFPVISVLLEVFLAFEKYLIEVGS